jgi:uncharacterized membrane protein YkvI
MAAVLIVAGAAAALTGAFCLSWQVGLIVVGLLVLAAGVDRA